MSKFSPLTNVCPFNEHVSNPINAGLPVLDLGNKPVSYFEFWPTWFFYTPIVLYWIVLGLRYRNFALPMLANPAIPMGGMISESKSSILDDAGDYATSYILPYFLREPPSCSALHNCDDLLRAHVENTFELSAQKGIECPFIVKPELGCRGAGVSIIESHESLFRYLKSFPQKRKYIVQKMAPYAAEAGVFYERAPGEPNGRVTSITLKYRPYVVGNGSSTLKSLILRNHRSAVLRDLYFAKNREALYTVPADGERIALTFAGSHCRGSIFRDGNQYISQSLSDEIDRIMQDFPNFHYGRLDVKFENIDKLQQAKDFVIIEVNGVSSEKTHIWDSRTSLWQAFATLFEQYTTLFKMGDAMRKKGYKAPSARALVATWLRELKQGQQYPELH